MDKHFVSLRRAYIGVCGRKDNEDVTFRKSICQVLVLRFEGEETCRHKGEVIQVHRSIAPMRGSYSAAVTEGHVVYPLSLAAFSHWLAKRSLNVFS
jgi:hypothetical protein